MKQFFVTLYARSRSLSAGEITRLLGAEPTGGHQRGTLAETGDRSYIDTYWWVDSGLGDEASMESHGGSLVARLAPLVPKVAERIETGELDLKIGVGIMYDTYTTSVHLPHALVAFAARVGASFEVSSYPTEFDSLTVSSPRSA